MISIVRVRTRIIGNQFAQVRWSQNLPQRIFATTVTDKAIELPPFSDGERVSAGEGKSN